MVAQGGAWTEGLCPAKVREAEQMQRSSKVLCLCSSPGQFLYKMAIPSADIERLESGDILAWRDNG